VPFRIAFREVELAAVQPHEILLEVLACGICGHDMEIATQLATEPKPFGHEVVGIVRDVGATVRHLRVGDQVALESSSFCAECDLCRNGRVDLCNKAPGIWSGLSMGFSGAMVAPGHSAVPCNGIEPLAAVLAEPCGVAVDMIKVAELGLSDNVLVVGPGAIGLMALALARRRTAGLVVAAGRSPGRLEAAMRLGADAVVNTQEVPLAECGKHFGGFHKVLSTAPPQTLPDSLDACGYGGVVVYIGFDWGEGGKITLDTTRMHLGKKQLRASFASPAVYLPEALQLLHRGIVPHRQIVSQTFPLSRLVDAFALLREDRNSTRKVVVIPDAHMPRLALP
jgi:L-iditol 2-dehydrogenase